MVLFSGGIFVTMAGILRCILILTNPITGAQQAGSWACRETFVAVVTTNLPMVFPLIRRCVSPFMRSVRSGLSSKNKSNNKSAGVGGTGIVTGGANRSVQGGFALEDKNPRRGRGPRSVHPLPNVSFTESDEYMYDDDELHQQELENMSNQRQKQQRMSRSSKQQGDIDIEQQALAPRPSLQAGQGSASDLSSPGSATLATVVRSGITKQVVLHITEEELRRRRSECGSSDGEMGDSNLDAIETIPGARQGNYFLTLNNVQQPQQQSQQPSSRRTNITNLFTTTSPPAATSPLASSS